MRKIKEVLRLHFELGLGQRQIARCCSIGQSTVHDYLRRAEAAGLEWPLPPECDDGQIEERLFGPRRVAPERYSKAAPDFAAIHEQLTSHKHVTLQLLWEEYFEQQPDGYRYSQFCELYRRWRRKLDVVLRQQHRAGEKLFVDYAGATVAVENPRTGELRQAQIFVAVLGASSYTYAEAAWTQQLPDWIGSHVRAFEFFGGAPEIVVPDNLRAGVSRACRYEPDLNRSYQEMAAHYGVAVVPARPRKPRDKAKVEVGVQIVERWILAALRQRRFTSLGELNQAIAALLERLNRRPFRRRSGSRLSLFEAFERPALRPLPAERYELAEWKTARVNIDYHIEVERHYYSVPHPLVGQRVEARLTAGAIEIFHRGRRVASHPRSRERYRQSTLDAHRPKSHQRHLEWTPSRLIDWARTVGPATAKVFETILASKPHPEMGYRSCLGVLRLSKLYSAERVEAASRRALRFDACSYQSLKSMLAHGLDRQTLDGAPPERPPIEHPNIRGAGYFDPPQPLATLDPESRQEVSC
jgi:transposase